MNAPAASSSRGPRSGVAAGVPYLALPPAAAAPEVAPIVVVWHLMDPPASPAAMAAAVPLDGVDAWRIHLGLPLSGERLPPGGADEIQRRGFEDAVLGLQYPITVDAAAEFPAALEALRDQLELGDGVPLALVGGSQGSAVALLTLIETAPAAGIAVDAVVAVSPVARLRDAVDATGRVYGVDYPWRPETVEAERRLDFVDRPPERAVPIRLIVGADDDRLGFRAPSIELAERWAEAFGDPSRTDVVIVEGMGHAFAAPPGLEPEPQTAAAQAVDAAATEWLARWLAQPPVATGRSGSDDQPDQEPT